MNGHTEINKALSYTQSTHSHLSLDSLQWNWIKKCRPSVTLATFQEFNRHMWLVATVLDNMDRGHFRRSRSSGSVATDYNGERRSDLLSHIQRKPSRLQSIFDLRMVTAVMDTPLVWVGSDPRAHGGPLVGPMEETAGTLGVVPMEKSWRSSSSLSSGTPGYMVSLACIC